MDGIVVGADSGAFINRLILNCIGPVLSSTDIHRTVWVDAPKGVLSRCRVCGIGRRASITANQRNFIKAEEGLMLREAQVLALEKKWAVK